MHKIYTHTQNLHTTHADTGCQRNSAKEGDITMSASTDVTEATLEGCALTVSQYQDLKSAKGPGLAALLRECCALDGQQRPLFTQVIADEMNDAAAVAAWMLCVGCAAAASYHPGKCCCCCCCWWWWWWNIMVTMLLLMVMMNYNGDDAAADGDGEFLRWRCCCWWWWWIITVTMLLLMVMMNYYGDDAAAVGDGDNVVALSFTKAVLHVSMLIQVNDNVMAKLWCIENCWVLCSMLLCCIELYKSCTARFNAYTNEWQCNGKIVVHRELLSTLKHALVLGGDSNRNLVLSWHSLCCGSHLFYACTLVRVWNFIFPYCFLASWPQLLAVFVCIFGCQRPSCLASFLPLSVMLGGFLAAFLRSGFCFFSVVVESVKEFLWWYKCKFPLQQFGGYEPE